MGEKKALYFFRMLFCKGTYCFKSANGKFAQLFIFHVFSWGVSVSQCFFFRKIAFLLDSKVKIPYGNVTEHSVTIYATHVL